MYKHIYNISLSIYLTTNVNWLNYLYISFDDILSCYQDSNWRLYFLMSVWCASASRDHVQGAGAMCAVSMCRSTVKKPCIFFREIRLKKAVWSGWRCWSRKNRIKTSRCIKKNLLDEVCYLQNFSPNVLSLIAGTGTGHRWSYPLT